MSKLQQLTALVFLVLWVPITAHCHLEKVPGLEFLKCPSDTQDSGCQDGCQVVESGLYKIPEHSVLVPAPVDLLVPCFEPTLADEVQPGSVPLGLLSLAPPDLRQSWQFVSRAALPVRAPSSLS